LSLLQSPSLLQSTHWPLLLQTLPPLSVHLVPGGSFGKLHMPPLQWPVVQSLVGMQSLSFRQPTQLPMLLHFWLVPHTVPGAAFII
jgi:hypothetical protein